MAERSKALDWNSSNIFTGVPGFESLSLRQFNDLRGFCKELLLAGKSLVSKLPPR